MRWFVYILECRNGSLYTGIAKNVKRRLKEHSQGKGSRYVRSHLPVHVVYQETKTSLSAALKREAQIKTFTRKIKLRLIQTAAACFLFMGVGQGAIAAEAAMDTRDSTSPFGVLDFVAWDHSWNNHHYSTKKIEKAAELMEKAGVAFIRMDFLWNDIEARQGYFSFTKYDNIVGILDKHHIKILGVLGYSANWTGQKWNEAPPKEAYISYAMTVVHRYKDRVRYWEIWNEPDSPNYWNPQDDMKTYSELLKDTSEALKAEDPTCQIVLGGLSKYWPINLKKVYKMAGKESFDIVNIHPFTDPLKKDGIQILKNNYLGVYRVMEKNGDADKPIWFTELGCPGNDNSSLRGWWLGRNPTEWEQAAWVEKVYGEPLRWKGVQKVFWAFFRDTPQHFSSGIDYFGLVNGNFTQKQAYLAYKKVSSEYKIKLN